MSDSTYTCSICHKRWEHCQCNHHKEVIELRDHCESFTPRQCGGCQALTSARDYIRILEERAKAKCLKYRKQMDYIDKLEEKAIQKEHKIFKLMALVFKLEIRVRKQQDCIREFTTKCDRLEGQKTDIDWFKERFYEALLWREGNTWQLKRAFP